MIWISIHPSRLFGDLIWNCSNNDKKCFVWTSYELTIIGWKLVVKEIGTFCVSNFQIQSSFCGSKSLLTRLSKKIDEKSLESHFCQVLLSFKVTFREAWWQCRQKIKNLKVMEKFVEKISLILFIIADYDKLYRVSGKVLIHCIWVAKEGLTFNFLFSGEVRPRLWSKW